jgi:hypothetical protein
MAKFLRYLPSLPRILPPNFPRHYAIYLGWVEEVVEIVTTATTTGSSSNASDEASGTIRDSAVENQK